MSPLYGRLLILIILASAWQSIAWLVNSSDFSSLLIVMESFIYHFFQGDMLVNLAITLSRVLISFIIAMILGVFISILMGNSKRINQLSDTLLIIVLNIPALVTILLFYIWFGLVESTAITAVIINKITTVVVMIREGARVVDEDLLNVAKVYKLSLSKTFFKVFFAPNLSLHYGLSTLGFIPVPLEDAVSERS
jgi:NitT/TauT family transport system permease protein